MTTLSLRQIRLRSGEEYRDEEDYTGQFIDDCVVRTGDPNDFVGNAELYRRYQLWAIQRGIRGVDLLNGVRLSRELVNHGLTRHKNPVTFNGVKVRGFYGLRLARNGTEHCPEPLCSVPFPLV